MRGGTYFRSAADLRSSSERHSRFPGNGSYQRGQPKPATVAAATTERSYAAEGTPTARSSTRQANGNGVALRSLEPPVAGEKPWWQDSSRSQGELRRGRTAPHNGRLNGSGSPTRPAGATMGRRDATPSNAAAMLDTAPLSRDQLPAEVVADIETDAGSREYVMDSEFRWAQDDYSSTRRTVEIWAFITRLRIWLTLVDQKWSYFGGFSEAKKSSRLRSLASWTRESVLQLGPTFIKLGQLFSTRSDLFPAEFTEELSKLQDRVPAFTSERAVAIIERELGAPVTSLFRDFERRPIAAASLGQVHRATLHSGERVVVKVQRPGLRRLFEIDLSNMQKLAGLLDRADPARDCTGIYNECRTILYQEVDYINEGRNADRFRRNFRDQAWVRVPTVSWQHTSPSVITLEYLPGMKISDVASLKRSGLDLRQIAQRSTEAYILQVIRHGFLHSDPHSGNLAVSAEGQLIWYDFGMMSEIKPATKDRLLDMFYAVYRQDAGAVIACLQDLGIIVPTGDIQPLKRAISFFLANINRQAERQETLSAIGEDLFSLAVDQPFRFPASFTFVLRAFSTLEGIGKLLIGADQYSFAAVAAPYAQELLDLQSARTFALGELGRQAADLSRATAMAPERIARIEGVTTALEQGSLRLRVRDAASERALRRSSVMQMATLQAVGAAGLLDVATQLQLAGRRLESVPAFGAAAVLLGLIGWGMRRIRRLDKFEKDLKGGGPAFRQ